jgi:hypothetical protein
VFKWKKQLRENRSQAATLGPWDQCHSWWLLMQLIGSLLVIIWGYRAQYVSPGHWLGHGVHCVSLGLYLRTWSPWCLFRPLFGNMEPTLSLLSAAVSLISSSHVQSVHLKWPCQACGHSRTVRSVPLLADNGVHVGLCPSGWQPPLPDSMTLCCLLVILRHSLSLSPH